MEILTEIVWIAKHRNEINEWYLKESGISSKGSVWYESYITNYVAQHAMSFRGESPQYVWYELNLGDTRTPKQLKRRSKPDLLLQFSDEIWIVEVKYCGRSPNLKLSRAKDCIEQLESYASQLKQLRKSGWFPKRKIRLAVFWAFWKIRKIPLQTDSEFQKWPIDRGKRID